MSATTLPPPPPPIVLTRSYKSRMIKGGTVIAADVLDLETHKRKLLDPDEYRSTVGACWACGSLVLHAHCFRERILRPASTDEDATVTTVRLYRCAAGSCRAVFTVLPAFIARHLWRAWKTVEAVAAEKAEAPRTTWRRWLGRLRSSAAQLVQLFMAFSATLLPPPMPQTVAKASSRQAFLDALSGLVIDPGALFAATAAWIHRLGPGIRLM